MKLSWSHAVLYVRDLDKMLKFYTDVLGFEVTDRGPIAPDAPDIVFLSQDADEHHQIAMLPVRKDEATRSNSVNHFAFRVENFTDVTELNKKLAGMDGINVGPLSHGNTLSIYFNDPEGNGLEVFWDTPWHVAQPQGQPWDTALDEAQALAWVEKNFGDQPSFEPREAYYARRRASQ
jgi:catechol-2,3-dioxygenase